MDARLKQLLNQASTFVSAAALAAMLVLPAPAWSQSLNGSGKTEATPVTGGAYTLDGQKFSARIVRDGGSGDGKNPGLGDILSFTDGKFSSEICRRYNFVDAPYWVRREGDKIHFLAELKSPTDGTMRWQGTIRGDTLEGTMQWRRKRWYWTIDATHKIRGKLKKRASSALPPGN